MDSALGTASADARLKAAFKSQLRLQPGIEPHLAGAIQETLHHPGNMIRAELAFRLARTYEVSEERAVLLAIAVEYFHTASLLFDDLPSMDDAVQRRGAPCVHRSYGEGAAILAALALINRAYALLWQAVAELPTAVQSRGLGYVERNLGVAGLLNGQSRDLHCSDGSKHKHQQIALGKTVSLVRLSLVLPAQLGGASAQEVSWLERLSVLWGLCYQILDDLKDVLHTSEQGGKTVARDAEMNRPNLALTIGVAASFRRASRLVELSDRVISRLAMQRKGLSFLQKTRERFQIEMTELFQATSVQVL